MIIQLNPTIPVYLTNLKQPGYCLAWLDYSQEHDTLWMVALENGEVWTVAQRHVRLQANSSLGRGKS